MAPCRGPPLCSIEAVISDKRPAGLVGRQLGLSGILYEYSSDARLLQQRLAPRRGSCEGVLYPAEQTRGSFGVESGDKIDGIHLRRKNYPMSFLDGGSVGSH